ncbi:MAG: GIY-YIG nuclease family protein [Elusimicrobiota bacterium]
MHARSKRTLKGLKVKTTKNKKRDWSVYILRCASDTLYTGIAKDVAARFKAHSSGKGARYTRAHLPLTLVYQEDGFTRSQALTREAEIKSYPRKKKEALAGLYV